MVDADDGVFGWNGKIVEVNLDSGGSSIRARRLEPEIAKKFLGGRGLGVYLVNNELKPGVDPLSPENILVFATGPLTGTAFPTSGRHAVVSKSPLTGTIFDSNSGGFWGRELKNAGWDALIVRGSSSEPKYILIQDGAVEVVPADKVWGHSAKECTKTLSEMHAGSRVACIGRPGERQALLACIMNDYGRAAGRGGLGAVMGSKNLKAVVVKGTGSTKVAKEDEFKAELAKIQRIINSNPVTNDSLPTLGTAVLVNLINACGMLPTNNFQEGVFEDAEGISGEKISETILQGRTGCAGCPIQCGRLTKTSRASGEGPEYETVWAFGSQCGVNDLERVAEANYVCNEEGLDTISTGSTIGCAMELSQKGMLEKRFGKDAPAFGDAERMLEVVREMASGETALGRELGEGSLRFARSHGMPGAAMQVKGLEIPGYDPRGVQGHALAYATSNRGGCHMRAYLISPEILGQPCLVDRFRTEGKAALVKVMQDANAAVDSLSICRFSSLALSPAHYARALSLITGIEFSQEEFMLIGERIWNLERLFNNREGFTKAQDTLPERFLKEELPEGPSRHKLVKLDEMLDEYYAARGWNREGIPTDETLRRLGLR